MSKMKCALVCCTFMFLLADAQFPRACINQQSLKNKECCPTPRGFTAPCGSDAKRGECKQLTGPRWSIIYKHYNEKHDLDDRHKWPLGFFDRACHCKSNFHGYDCSKCEFGFHGVDCQQRKTLIRRNFSRLPDEEKDKYMQYINKSKFTTSHDYVVATTFHQDIKQSVKDGVDLSELFVNVTVYDLFVWLHYYASGDPDSYQADFGHAGQGFPTFHRYLTMTWERALQEVSGDHDFTIPFWDWRDKTECDICTRDFLGVRSNTLDGSVVGRYLDDWYMTCADGFSDKEQYSGTRICDPRIQRPGLYRISAQERKESEDRGFVFAFPTKKEVDFILQFELYDVAPYNNIISCSFRNLLEGFASTVTGFGSPDGVYMHNRVHKVIGGCMAASAESPNDPIFPLHHSFVDRIFEKWLRKYNKTASVLAEKDAPIGQDRESPILPMFPIRTHGQVFQQSFALGYDYEDLDETGWSPDDEEDDMTLGWGCCHCHDAARSWCEKLEDYHRYCGTQRLKKETDL